MSGGWSDEAMILANAAAFPVKNVLTLAIWAVLGIALAARFFRWE